MTKTSRQPVRFADDDNVLPSEWFDGQASASGNSKAGNAVKSLYTFYRRLCETRLSGVASNYSPSPSFDAGPALSVEDKPRKSTWDKLATEMRDASVVADLYIPQLFSVIAATGMAIPKPQQLMSEKYRQCYVDAVKTKANDLTVLLKTQVHLASTRILSLQRYLNEYHSNGRTETQILCEATLCVAVDDVVPLTPLFRVCLAANALCEEGLSQYVVDKYFPAAFLEYSAWKREYDAAWRQQLPETFKQRAAQCKARL